MKTSLNTTQDMSKRVPMTKAEQMRQQTITMIVPKQSSKNMDFNLLLLCPPKREDTVMKSKIINTFLHQRMKWINRNLSHGRQIYRYLVITYNK